MKYKLYLLFIFIAFILTSCKSSDNALSPETAVGKWEVISNTEINSLNSKIFFADRRNGWAIGDSGTVKATSDGGLTWTSQVIGTKEALSAVYFIDSNNGIVGGLDRYIYKTTDGGHSWKKIQFNENTANSVTFIKSIEGRLYLGSGNKIYGSQDNGETWQYKYTISEFPVKNFFLFGSTGYACRWISHNLIKTQNDGLSWSTVPLPFYFLNDIHFTDASTGWATEDNTPSSFYNDTSSVWVTYDGGNNWKKAFSVQAVVTGNITFLDKNNGWFSCWNVRNAEHGSSSRIYHTTDGGKTFNAQYSSDDNDFVADMFFLDNNNAWALTHSGKVIRYSK